MKLKIKVTIILALGFILTGNSQTNFTSGQTKFINPNGRTIMIERNDNDSWLTFHDPNNYWFSMGIDRSKGGVLSLNNGGSLTSTQFVMNSSGNIGLGLSNPSGRLHVKGETYIDGGWLRVLGNKGLYFQNYGGGLYMKDNTWIRTSGNKSFYHNSGTMRTDGTFQVGSSGSRFLVKTNGNVGIGNTSPQEKLHIKGSGSVYGKIESTNNNAYWVSDIGGQNGGGLQIQNKGVYKAFVYWTNSSPSRFAIWVGGQDRMTISNGGNVGIGTNNTKGFKLGVNGKIAATEVKVANYANWADFVFEKDYQLPTLAEVENLIQVIGHLKDIPSAEEVGKDGFFLAEMNAKLLQKIEELTLYTIQQEKKLKELNQKIINAEAMNKKLLEFNLDLKN
ncbi:MAG: shufflon system plasmid conjugative transfer pilus tip adhesin PilV [Flavobacteriales bacterium]|nr:shufflon system plasmid conjugative transfer pilus tip adhesin PilV [Flavobacteriales bacterium]